MGWTQHTVGVQYIRTASILQLLLGNIGRPGGGIMALRGHASIQGSTDIPTLYNLLPGYIPMPHAHKHIDLDTFVGENAGAKGFWGNMRAYTVSMLKSWWGDAATAENDFCFDYLPRLTGTHDSTDTVERQINEGGGGYFLVGENPAVGTANARMQRAGLANLDWLVVRDLAMIESATFWKDGTGDRDRRDADRGHRYRGLLLPRRQPRREAGQLHQHAAAAPVAPQGARSAGRRPQRPVVLLPSGSNPQGETRGAPPTSVIGRCSISCGTNPMEPGTDEPDAVAVLAEINGTGPDGQPLSMYTQLRDDGSTRCGCWIYCGVYGDGVNQADRRRSRHEQGPVAPDWGWGMAGEPARALQPRLGGSRR